MLDREPIRLPALAGHDDDLWAALIELSELRPGEWTLVGGQMVFLHAIEHGVSPPRVSTDLDVLVNARVVTGGVREFVASIEERGFVLAGASPEGIAHRYQRGGVRIDVLAPEGLGPRADLTTTPPGRTLQVPGGTQALERTELVPVAFGDRGGLVPRPSLLGAIVGKAVAVDVDDVPEAQRLDLALLLSLVGDPLSMASRLTKKDRQRLRGRSEMADADQRAWVSLPAVHKGAAWACYYPDFPIVSAGPDFATQGWLNEVGGAHSMAVGSAGRVGLVGGYGGLFDRLSLLEMTMEVMSMGSTVRLGMPNGDHLPDDCRMFARDSSIDVVVNGRWLRLDIDEIEMPQ